MRQTELEHLLQEMSLEEKVGQLVQVTGDYFATSGKVTGPLQAAGFRRESIQLAGSVLGTAGAGEVKRIQTQYMDAHPHHIPLLFMADIINGYRTIFPIPLAQGCTFDPELVRQAAATAARESAAAGIHITFSPMVDLVKDPRWGRVMESTGEDGYLNSCYARAMVRGYQGKELEPGTIGACVKHFAAYGAPAGGREYNYVELSERTLREEYLPAYEAAVEAGSELVMTAFHTLNRIPCTGSRELLRDILREEMGFEGVVISDWNAVRELTAHGFAEDEKEAARLALEAGVDIDMMSPCYADHLASLVTEGIIDPELLNQAVMRVLRLKNRLGLFENPYRSADEAAEAQLILSREHRRQAKKMAAASMVLLKNEGILPLKRGSQKLVLAGPFVEDTNLNGAWSIFGNAEECVSIAEGMRAKSPTGLSIFRTDRPSETLLKAASEAKTVILVLGERSGESGEAHSKADLTISETQLELFRTVKNVNSDIVTVLLNGRPLDLREIACGSKAVLEAWLPGTEGGSAVADLLYGDESPSGRLCMSFPFCTGQIPVCYNEFYTGRPVLQGIPGDRYRSRYIDIPNQPLYPFGFGLTYTNFSYSPVILSSDRLMAGESLEAAVTVKNIGDRIGTETVQLYIQDVCGSVVRPVRELKGFQKITLSPGEERKITFEIREPMLRFYDIHMRRQSEPGKFIIYVGGDSRTENSSEFWL